MVNEIIGYHRIITNARGEEVASLGFLLIQLESSASAFVCVVEALEAGAPRHPVSSATHLPLRGDIGCFVATAPVMVNYGSTQGKRASRKLANLLRPAATPALILRSTTVGVICYTGWHHGTYRQLGPRHVLAIAVFLTTAGLQVYLGHPRHWLHLRSAGHAAIALFFGGFAVMLGAELNAAVRKNGQRRRRMPTGQLFHPHRRRRRRIRRPSCAVAAEPRASQPR